MTPGLRTVILAIIAVTFSVSSPVEREGVNEFPSGGKTVVSEVALVGAVPESEQSYSHDISDSADVNINDLRKELSRLHDSHSKDSGEGGEDNKRSFNPWGGKRTSYAEFVRRGFQPWGGKRSSSLLGDKKSRDGGVKRAFSPCGGKRSDGDDGKRAFNPWGGKRADNKEDKRAFNPWGGKRSDEGDDKRAFSPWGGKRSPSTKDKQAFNPWGGKRSTNEGHGPFLRSWGVNWGAKRDREVGSGLKKWAVKRSVEEEQPRGLAVHQESGLEHHVVKRSTLSDWRLGGGEQPFMNGYNLPRYPQTTKRTFNPWGGKRTFSPWGGKREFNPWGGKRTFQPWGGKRKFNPWGGKRTLSGDWLQPSALEYSLLVKSEPEPAARYARQTTSDMNTANSLHL